MPNSNRIIRLNRAGFGLGKGEMALLVRDVGPEVSDFHLQEHFASKYPSVQSAMLISARGTGAPTGSALVHFASEEELERALVEMDGAVVGRSVIQVSRAKPRRDEGGGDPARTLGIGVPAYLGGGSLPVPQHPWGSQGAAEDEQDNVVFVGGLPPTVTVEELSAQFSRFGTVTMAHIAHGKSYGFVHYATRAETAAAVEGGGRVVLGGARPHVSWRRGSGLPLGGGQGPSPLSALPAAGFPRGADELQALQWAQMAYAAAMANSGFSHRGGLGALDPGAMASISGSGHGAFAYPGVDSSAVAAHQAMISSAGSSGSSFAALQGGARPYTHFSGLPPSSGSEGASGSRAGDLVHGDPAADPMRAVRYSVPGAPPGFPPPQGGH